MNVLLNSNGSIANIDYDAIAMEGEYFGDDMMDSMTEDVSDSSSSSSSVMSSWLFVIGISATTLVISVVLGILLAKKRIKKGFDLYED